MNVTKSRVCYTRRRYKEEESRVYYTSLPWPFLRAWLTILGTVRCSTLNLWTKVLRMRTRSLLPVFSGLFFLIIDSMRLRSSLQDMVWGGKQQGGVNGLHDMVLKERKWPQMFEGGVKRGKRGRHFMIGRMNLENREIFHTTHGVGILNYKTVQDTLSRDTRTTTRLA